MDLTLFHRVLKIKRVLRANPKKEKKGCSEIADYGDSLTMSISGTV
jgi:hypothetical protein